MAERTEIAAEIEALAVHCRPPLMEVDQRSSWLRDWCGDLTEFPIEAIRVGCRKWRHSGATKFPTAGQLLPLVKANLPVETRDAPQPWRPATEAEYGAMTVREKIREHLILASEAADKAGPMFRNTSGGGPMSRASGLHIAAEDMAPVWRQWRDIERNHLREVGRLREITRTPMPIAAEG